MDVSKTVITLLLIVVLVLVFVGPGMEVGLAEMLSSVISRPSGTLIPDSAGGGRGRQRGNCGDLPVNRETGECSRIPFGRLPKEDSDDAMFTRMGRGGIPRDANGNICQIGTCSQVESPRGRGGYGR